MDITPEAISQYASDLIPKDDPVRAEMEALAREREFPIVGPLVGRLLYQLAAIKKPVGMFEMGSGFGYSAYWLIRGAPDSRIICTESSAGHIKLALNWMQRAGVLDRMVWHHDRAEAVLAGCGRTFDLIFNDVDKESYPDVFKLALKHLNPGGLLITDNVLWKGRVADGVARDAATRAIREYNRLMFSTPGVFSSIVPIRDGLGITLKM